jgi:hypothetical protein
MIALARFIATEGLMIIAFVSTQMRNICEDPESADAYMGKARAEAFRHRLADISAAVTRADLLVGNPTTGGESGEELRISIGPRGTLVLAANHLNMPLDQRGAVDWNKVAYVKVVKVELR